MTYEKATNALVKAGLLDKGDASTAAAALAKSPVEFTYPAWAQALAKAGLIDGADVDAAAAAMEEAAAAEAKDDPTDFEESLENAGIL